MAPRVPRRAPDDERLRSTESASRSSIFADPVHLRARSDNWLLSPLAPYERSGDVPNVVFPCGGNVVDGRLRLYYGAADTCVALATAKVSDLLDLLLSSDRSTRPGAP